ncbi:MAG TPA: lytic transglycosylase domain-containing protein [Ktedonosporobacter sp.]|nr:lytic transglycosylase domain-containing protein [Ktedonosporobacter sp.]
MPQSESHPPFQHPANDLAEELYPDIFSIPPTSPTTPPPAGRLPDREPQRNVGMTSARHPAIGRSRLMKADAPAHTDKPRAVQTEQLFDTDTPQVIKPVGQPRLVRTDQLTTVPRPVPTVPETPSSLIAALQSTMTGPKKQPLIIPGSRKRGGVRSSSAMGRATERPVRSRTRSVIVLLALLLVFLLTLFTFTPLSSATNQVPFLHNVIDWVRSSPINWQAVPHQAPTTTPQNTLAAPVAPLPPVVLPASQYVVIARQDALNAGISPDYFVRQINQESGFNPNAVSPAGAVGIAQFLPSTAQTLGVNPYDPIDALRGAARYMASISNQYGGDYAKALAAYNSGTGTVDYAVRVGGAYWMNYLPGETRNYILVIMGI